MRATEGFYGWKLVGVLWAITIVNLGLSNYGAGVINAAMAKDLHLARGTLGFGFTVFVLAAGYSSPLAAEFVKRVGARLTLLAGSLLIALGAFVLASYVSQGWHYVLAFGVLVGMGCGVGVMVPAQSCVAMWFERRRAFAMSIVLTGSGVGGFIAAPLLTRLISVAGGNWRMGWYFVLGSAVLAGLASLLFVRNNPVELVQLPDGGAGEVIGRHASEHASPSGASVYRTSDSWTVRQAAKTRAMWLIGLAAVCIVALNTAVLAHGVPHLRDLGHSPDAAARAFGALALSSIFGKLSAGFLCDRIEPRYVWCGGSVVMALGVLAATQASGVVPMYLFTILMGFGGGASLACWPAMVANYFGAASVAAILGAQFPIINSFAALAPFLVGAVYDAQGSYTMAFYFIAVCGLGTAAMLLSAVPPSRDRGQAESGSARLLSHGR